MSMMTTYKDILSLWKTLKLLSEDIEEDYSTVAKWSARNKVPSRYWAKILRASEKSEHLKPETAHQLTPDDFIRIAENLG